MGKRQYSDQDKATILAARDANGGNVSRSARETGVPRKTLEDWAKGRSVADDVAEIRQEKRLELAEKLDFIAHRLADNMTEEKMKSGSIVQIATSLGITIEKAQLLKGQPTSIAGTPLEGLTADDKRALREAIRRDLESADPH